MKALYDTAFELAAGGHEWETHPPVLLSGEGDEARAKARAEAPAPAP